MEVVQTKNSVKLAILEKRVREKEIEVEKRLNYLEKQIKFHKIAIMKNVKENIDLSYKEESHG